METPFEPLVFTHHKLHLHALIVEHQAWFYARDLGRLMGRDGLYVRPLGWWEKLKRGFRPGRGERVRF